MDNHQNALVLSEARISAVVVRCGCNDPDSHNGKNGPPRQCPQPRSTEDLGVISFYSSNPLKRWAWGMGNWLKSWAEGGRK